MKNREATLLIEHATVVTMDRMRRIIDDGSIVAGGDKIIDVGKFQDIRSKYREPSVVIDATGMAAVPGLINAHKDSYYFHTMSPSLHTSGLPHNLYG